MGIYLEKLKHPTGLCCAIANSDMKNVDIANAIMHAFMSGYHLQQAKFFNADWYDVRLLPLDFVNFVYRIKPDEQNKKHS